METKCWLDKTEWHPANIQSPPVLADEEDLDNVGYTNENLFDEGDEEPHNKYLDMDMIDESNEEENSTNGMTKYTTYDVNAEMQTDGPILGLTAINDNRWKNLDPTMSEALSREDKKHWEEAMHKELDGLRAMGTWEITDLPKGMNAVNMCWVLKIKTDANLIPTKFKASCQLEQWFPQESF
ncbi:hypothetical protein NDA14_002335 [Ustilago hordei]|nr:hypothetical protein NDA15_001664 [Ustilago hordei]KAJ1597262.1 hypothetical protein NDA14_002335 [Ustilago hordei]